VFVSNAHGNDVTGNGTKESPYASITKGLSSAAGKKVFVCLGLKGDYTDELSFNGSEDVSIYGGFECETWEYSTTRKAGIKPAKNIALRINNSKNLTFENLRIMAADATGKDYDASSYGAFVTDSSGVVFRRVEITAGKGAKGADGDPGVKGANGADKGIAPVGDAGLCNVTQTVAGGRWGAVTACEASQGGNGADGQKNTANGNDGSTGAPTEHITPTDGQVENGGIGALTDEADGGTGKKGGPGDAGISGIQGSLHGTFTVSGYSASNGNAGTDGFPGQGGGGGGASKGTAACYGASGGAGGMGGCGGTAGKGGMGGGASVALMSSGSEVD
jgi:hypothetical protein